MLWGAALKPLNPPALFPARYSEVSFLELDKFLEDVRWVRAHRLGSPGMWGQDGHRECPCCPQLSPQCPRAQGTAQPCSFLSQLCRGWNQLLVLPLCLCQEWDLPPDELRRLQTPCPPTGPVPAPGGSPESQDPHTRAL